MDFQELLNHPEFPEGTCWQRKRFQTNQTVFREGEEGAQIYIVLSGLVRVLGNVTLDDQRRISPGFSELGEGEVFGELALFDGQPRSASVVAARDSELAVIAGDDLMAFFDSHPDIGYAVLKTLIRGLSCRLRKSNERFFHFFAWGLKARGMDGLL